MVYGRGLINSKLKKISEWINNVKKNNRLKVDFRVFMVDDRYVIKNYF